MNPAVAARWQELAPRLDALLDLPAGQRDSYIDTQVDDASLRQLLRELLAREAQPGFLDRNSADYAESLLAAAAAPLQIGSWRVLDLIGEGGSGSVYRAEREADGYVQRAALKLLRVGLRDPQEQARFRRERRILARLEHPAIARLIDGGFTPEGVPWFALEYIEGEAVTRWCDQRRLAVGERLRLFVEICDAVDAAHRALIVHRDLKPANILVDAQGRPHLLDFGIAKLLDDADNDDDTRTGLRRLTPAYAAPEQFGGGVITTATDVYALGVLLHELLSGHRPGLRRDAAPRPLSQCPTQEADAAASAQARSTTPRQLALRLRGDLDVIAATALAAEPARRYPGVAALAADLRAHLAGRPIAARRASTAYRVKKFLLRHRAAAAAVLLVLCTGIAGLATTWRESQRANAAAVEARQQAHRANAVKDFLLAMFAGVSPDESKGREVGARELIERSEAHLAETLASNPSLKTELSTALASAQRQLGDLDRARKLADQAVAAAADPALAAAARIERARVLLAQGEFAAAVADLEPLAAGAPTDMLREDAQLRLAEVLVEKGDPKAARATLEQALARSGDSVDAAVRLRRLAALGPVQFRAGDLAGSEKTLLAALALARDLHGERHTETARIAHDLAVTLLQRGANDEAAALLTTARATRLALLGDKHPDLAQSEFELAVARQRLGDAAAARPLYERALAVQRLTLGPYHANVVSSLNSLAVLAWTDGRADEAIARLQEAIAAARRGLGEQHPTLATLLGNLSGFERYGGRLDDSLQHAHESAAIARHALGERHFLVGVALLSVAATQAELGQQAQALDSYREALQRLDAALGAHHADALTARAAYADALLASGDRAGAQREVDTVMANLGDGLAPGHPRRARLELVQLRVRIAAGGCADAVAPLQSASASLAKGGAALLPDLASAQFLLARCQRERGDATAAQSRTAAEATARRLPYLPRRLRAEQA